MLWSNFFRFLVAHGKIHKFLRLDFQLPAVRLSTSCISNVLAGKLQKQDIFTSCSSLRVLAPQELLACALFLGCTVVPKVNHRLSRYQLQRLRQKNDEFVYVFLTRCQNQATRCRCWDKKESDEHLIEQLIVGTKDKKVRERLVEKGEQLTLDEAINISRTYEATQSMDGESNKDICDLPWKNVP